MKLVLNDEEQMVREAAAGFLAEQAGPDALRKLRDDEEPLGYSADTWQQMSELGWPGVLIPEAYGGLGFSHVAMGQISEQAGRTLASSPLFATAVVGVTALSRSGSEKHQAELLPKVAAGELTLALAIDEGARHAPWNIAMTASEADGGYVLEGDKRLVVDGHMAQQLIVAARTAGEPGQREGVTLFLVSRDAPGLDVQRTAVVDSRNSATIHFDKVTVDAANVLGKLNDAAAVLEPVLDVANAHLAAELLGIAGECFGRTLQYLKDRSQFGVPIGSFQALQHRAAILWTEIELCKSIVLKALRALDESDGDASLLASMAKAKTCRTAELATNEGVQMHGGIGMTDEFDIGFFLKRARVAQLLFGDHRYHLDRCATRSGY